MSIHLKIQGEGYPLVLFHGWGFDHRIWLELAAKLEKRYRLYLVDLPGFNQTNLMDWPSFKQKLLLQLPRHFALLGWSMGGLFAMRLAFEEPQRITHLINVTSSPRFVTDHDWPGVDQTILDGFFLKLVSNPEQTLREFTKLQSRERVLTTIPRINPNTPGLKAGLTILQEWDLRASLHEIEQPTCFIFGKLDAIIPKMTLAAMQAKYPRFNYHLFAKAAHMPFLSHQSEFIECIEKLLL